MFLLGVLTIAIISGSVKGWYVFLGIAAATVAGCSIMKRVMKW